MLGCSKSRLVALDSPIALPSLEYRPVVVRHSLCSLVSVDRLSMLDLLDLRFRLPALKSSDFPERFARWRGRSFFVCGFTSLCFVVLGRVLPMMNAMSVTRSRSVMWRQLRIINPIRGSATNITKKERVKDFRKL